MLQDYLIFFLQNFDTWVDNRNRDTANADALADLIQEQMANHPDVIVLIGVSDAGNNCNGVCLEMLSSLLQTDLETIKFGGTCKNYFFFSQKHLIFFANSVVL